MRTSSSSERFTRGSRSPHRSLALDADERGGFLVGGCGLRRDRPGGGLDFPRSASGASAADTASPPAGYALLLWCFCALRTLPSVTAWTSLGSTPFTKRIKEL